MSLIRVWRTLLNPSDHSGASFKSSIFNYNFHNRKFGLCETTLNKTSILVKDSVKFDLKSISFYTNEPNLIFSIKNPAKEHIADNSALMLSIVKRVLNLRNVSNTGTSPFNMGTKELSFTMFNLNSTKYYIYNVAQSNIVILGQFSRETKCSMIELFLHQIVNAYYNFVSSKSNLLNSISKLNLVNGPFNIKMFELFFCNPIIKHFESTTKSLFKKKDMNIPNINYKDLYLVDLSNNDIFFNWSSVRNKRKSNKKYENNKLLWNEIIYHCNHLKEQYIKNNEYRFDSIEYQNYFVKLEYSASYPRLSFIIKFLPILKGVGLIHVYSQNKLSTNEEIKFQYKEFDLKYGNETNKESGRIEYRYKEPKRLKELEFFFIEFLMSCHSSFGFFVYPKYELKYFDTSVLQIIEKAITTDIDAISYEKLLSKITNSLYEEYLIMKEMPKDLNKDNSYIHNGLNQKTIEENNGDENESSIQKTNFQWNLFSGNDPFPLYQINTFFFLKEIFTVLNPELKAEDLTIMLSERSDKSMFYDSKNEPIYRLMNNEISLLSKCYLEPQRKLNAQNALCESLFNINMTAIDAKTKEKDFKTHKACKSEIFSIKKKSCEKANRTIMAGKDENEIMLDFSNQSDSSSNFYRINNSDSDNNNDNNSSPIKENKSNRTKPMLSTTANKL